MLNFQAYPLWINAAAFLVAAGFVWYAGTKLAQYVDRIATKTGMGYGFAGLLLLGGITSLPEVATVSTASFSGNAPLAVNNLLGSVAINVVLLALADALVGRDALTSVVGRPSTMLQGVFGIILLAVIAAGISIGGVPIGGIDASSATLVPIFVFAMWLSGRYKHRPAWIPDHRRERRHGQDAHRRNGGNGNGAERRDSPQNRPRSGGGSPWMLTGRTAGVSLIILVAGYVLAKSGDAIATQTGVGAGLIGLVLVGFATSLPEISSIHSAVKLQRYEMAIGDIFGTNMWDAVLIFLADAIYMGGPVLGSAGSFEAVATLLGVVLTCIYLIGLLERRDKTILRMGYDSLAVIVTYAAGLVLLWFL